MLAKLWKKILLAICIVACLFNIMSKIVNRTSLELNLKSVENGESIFSIFEEEQQSESTNGVVNSEETTTTPEDTQNTVNQNQTEQKNATDFVVIY